MSYDGQIRVLNGLTCNGGGAPVALKGLGLYGLESQPIGGSWLTTEWGNLGQMTTAPAGPVWPLMAQWGANSARIALNAQVFLGLNFAVFSASGSSAAPSWVGTTATAASTGTSLTVGSTVGFIGTSQGVGPTYLLNLTHPFATNPQITTATGTTITTASACTVQVGDVLSMVKAADAPGQIRQAIQTAISYCRQLGMYLIWDLHWTAPQFTFPVVGTSTNMTAYCGALGQPPFMDAGAGQEFWGDPVNGFPAWLLANYGPKSANYNAKYGPTGIGDMIFELFNEPYADFLDAQQGGTYTSLTGASCTAGQAMMNGGHATAYLLQYSQPANGAGIPNAGNYGGVISVPYALYGYQQAVTAIRGLGLSNIIMVNAPSYAQAVSQMTLVGLPTDALTQIAVGWHPYEDGTTGFPTGGNATQLTAATNIANGKTFGRPVPMIITEFGDDEAISSGPAAPAVDTYVASIQNYASGEPQGSVGVHCFQWTSPLPAGKSAAWAELTAAGNPISFIPVSIVGTTLTVPAGTPTLPLNAAQSTGWPGLEGTWIVAQLSPTTYQLSNPMPLLASVSQSFDTLIPCQGQGQTVYNWMVNHGGSVSTTQNGVGTISYAAVAGFPAGSTVDHIAVSLTGTASGNTTPIAQNVAPGTASVTFANLTPDTYKYSVQGMPASGSGFGTALTGNLMITSTATISLNLPSAVTWTQP